MKRIKPYILFSLLSLGCLAGFGLRSVSPQTLDANHEQQALAEVAAPDSLDEEDEPVQKSSRPVYATIKVLTRCYGDSVVLRWSGEDFPTQQALHAHGVDVLRYDYKAPEGVRLDTLVSGFKPWTQKQFEDFYPKSDSVAYIGIGMLYSKDRLTPYQTKSASGTLGSLLDINEDQKMHLMFAVLVSEWRPDMADRMAMRWVDRNVEAGHEYEYIVRPTVIDTTGALPIIPTPVRVTNVPFEKSSLDVTIGDSVVGPYKVRLWWEDKGVSSYEIERRKVGETEWTRCNTLPYLNMTSGGDDGHNYDCSYGDVVPEVGLYEYRVFGHDAFGELTNPSPIHRVYMPDMSAPLAPELMLVEIDRQDPTDLSKQVMATFHFKKDSLEEDFVGFMPMYYSSQQDKDNFTGEKKWTNLSKELLHPGDSLFTCDMTGRSTGYVIVAAYDTAHNVSYSLPRMVQIKDVKAPGMMRNFKAETSIEDGTITLTWEPDSVDDDIEYYELTYANDTTHTFMLRSEGKLKECRYVDTVAMDVNQKYIYYKVRAVDYSTNQSEDTPALQVIRPTRIKPGVAHLYHSAVDSTGIRMDWACSNEQILDHHILLRRLEGAEQWDTLAVYQADFVNEADHLLSVLDNPPYVRGKEYQYCVESFSCTGVSSGHSLIFCTMYEGPRYISIPLNLTGIYDTKNKETILKWEVNNGKPLQGNWYVSIFRKGPHDEYSSFYISVPKNVKERHSRMLVPGQTESYYIKIIFEDGRESYASPSVSVKAPEGDL